MKLILVFIAIFFLQSVRTFAQVSKNKVPKNEIAGLYEHLSLYIDSIFMKTTRLSSACGTGHLFIAFNTTKKGEVRFLRTNDGASTDIGTVMQDAMKASAVKDNLKFLYKRWKNSEFILPVLYQLKGCKEDLLDPVQAMIERERTGDVQKEKLKSYSFLHMIDFDKENGASEADISTFFDGIILTPFDLHPPII